MWKRSKEIERFHSGVFDVYEEHYTTTQDREIVRYSVRHPGAAVFLPITSAATLLLVKQYRAPVGCDLVEAPAGTLETGEDPLDCAKREIQEEVGYRADTWTPLGTLYPAPGFCDEQQHLFLAQDLSPSRLEGDEDEEIEVVELSLSDVQAMIAQNTIVDAKTICLVYRYLFMLQE